MIVKKLGDKKVILDRQKDECLYMSPRNLQNITRGEDLYRHVTKKGTIVYYIYSWSMWQGETCDYKIVNEETAKDFLLDRAGEPSPYGLSRDEIEKAQKLFPDLFEEDA